MFSANMNFVHSTKPSNRYIANPNVTYVANPNLYDLGYVSILPTSDGLPPTWYPNSSYSPPYGQDYAIYSAPAPNSFIYDPPAPFFDFEDASSITTDSTASPALSTDSLETLKSPVNAGSLIDELDTPQADNRAIQSSFPVSSQVASVPRTPSTGHPISGDPVLSAQHFVPNIIPFHDMHRPLQTPFSDDSRSTISELEVEERDRIAKINAGYNATSHVGFYTSPSQSPKYSADRFREANGTLQPSSLQTRSCLRLAVSQPRHPDLHFPPRSIGNDKKDLSSSYQIYANPVLSVSSDLSPPSVERIPSQLSPDKNVNLAQTQSSPLAGSRSHEVTPDSDRSSFAQIHTSSPTGFTHSVPQPGHPSNVDVNPSYRNLPPSPLVPVETSRKHRPSVLITNGHPSQPVAIDGQGNLQYKQQSRSDAANSIQPSTTIKSQNSAYNSPPDPRPSRDLKSSPHTQINRTTENETDERLGLGSHLRKDVKTPGRGHLYISASPESMSRFSQDVYSSDQESHKSSPKRFLDNSSQSPSETRVSSTPSSLVSRSSSPLSIEDAVSRHPTSDDNRQLERNRRLRNTGTERATQAVYMHAQSPLHLSPEDAFSAFPDSQVTSVVYISEPRPTDVHHSKTVYDQSSISTDSDSRESHKARAGQYARPQPETTKRESNDLRMPSNAHKSSSPVTKSATSPSSKPSLDSPPTTVPEPHRRHSDGDQVPHPIRPPLSGRNSTPLVRSVRWTENLVAPSPILGPLRRKGWFNRRGDQLWTNSGDYRPPRSGEEYPLDLNDYPEPGDGWMNEDGVRIDMGHRRIPKALPRPVLKKP